MQKMEKYGSIMKTQPKDVEKLWLRRENTLRGKAFAKALVQFKINLLFITYYYIC